LQYCHGLVQKNCPGAHLQYNAYRRRMEALEKGGHRAETRAHPMYKEYREKGWRGLGGGIDASTSGSTDAMPERLYSSSLQHSTKRDDLAPLDFMQEAQRFSPDGQDHRPIRQRQKTSSKSRSVAGGLQGEDWLSGKNLVASTQRGHETGVRHSSFRPPPEKVTTVASLMVPLTCSPNSTPMRSCSRHRGGYSESCNRRDTPDSWRARVTRTLRTDMERWRSRLPPH